MAKYEVELKISSFSYEVEADNEEEAREKAEELMNDDISNNPRSIVDDAYITKIKDETPEKLAEDAAARTEVAIDKAKDDVVEKQNE